MSEQNSPTLGAAIPDDESHLECPTGFLRRMATVHALPCSVDITLAGTNIPGKTSLLGQESTLSSAPIQAMQSLFGELQPIDRMAKKASNVRSSATKGRSDRPSLSDRQTQSLITAGLVAGTTPSSIRMLSGVAIRDFASLPLDGGTAENPRKGC